MSYTLYNRLGSAGLAIEATLQFADLPFKLVEIDSIAGDPTPESFRDTNPWGQLPTLILPNGDTLTEAPAILIHLASAHPETDIGPPPGTPGFAQFARWMIFASVNVHEAFSRKNYPFRYTEDADAYPAMLRSATQRAHESMALIESAVTPGPFLLGDHMTGADIYIAMFYAWLRGKVELPQLGALERRVSEHAAVAPVWKRHILDRIPR